MNIEEIGQKRWKGSQKRQNEMSNWGFWKLENSWKCFGYWWNSSNKMKKLNHMRNWNGWVKMWGILKIVKDENKIWNVEKRTEYMTKWNIINIWSFCVKIKNDENVKRGAKVLIMAEKGHYSLKNAKVWGIVLFK